MTKKSQKTELNKPVLQGALLEFMDDHLLPAMDTLIDKKFDEKFDEKFDKKFDEKFDEKFEEKMANYPTKAYLDDKLADQTAEIFARLDRERWEPDKKYKNKVIDIFKKNKLGTKSEIKYLKSQVK